jgi:hypothetical protein
MVNKMIPLILCAFIVACGAAPQDEMPQDEQPIIEELTISGLVQKGIYQIGTGVDFNGLDDQFNAIIGESASTTIYDNEGNYSSTMTFPTATYAQVTACGFFLNELTGAFTTDRFCSSSLVYPNTGPNSLNIATGIIERRLKILSQSGIVGQPAIDQATEELTSGLLYYDAATLPTGVLSLGGANEWGISDDSPLLALSALALSVNPTIQELESWVGNLGLDLEDGTINQTTKDQVSLAAGRMNTRPIESNVSGYFGGVGSTSTAKDIERWLSIVDPTRGTIVSHVQKGNFLDFVTFGMQTNIAIPIMTTELKAIRHLELQFSPIGIEIRNDAGGVPGTLIESAVDTSGFLPARKYFDAQGIEYSLNGNLLTFSNQVELQANTHYWLVLDIQNATMDFYDGTAHSNFLQSVDGGLTWSPFFTGSPYVTFLN